MSNVLLIAQRDLKAHVRSPLGYLAAAAALLIDGIWFIAKAVGTPNDKRLSAKVLFETFHGITGVTMILGVVLSMRLLAQEREHGTLVLLKTAPLSDRDLVLGKFLSVMAVMLVITGLTVYMPALIFLHGKVSVGHILVGYCGVLLLAAATASVGLFASAIARSQVIAVIVAAALMGTMVLWWLLAKMTSPPVQDFLGALAIHHHHQLDFMNGVLRLEHVVYYLVVTAVFLLAATKTLEARRWR